MTFQDYRRNQLNFSEPTVVLRTQFETFSNFLIYLLFSIDRCFSLNALLWLKQCPLKTLLSGSLNIRSFLSCHIPVNFVPPNWRENQEKAISTLQFYTF